MKRNNFKIKYNWTLQFWVSNMKICALLEEILSFNSCEKKNQLHPSCDVIVECSSNFWILKYEKVSRINYSPLDNSSYVFLIKISYFKKKNHLYWRLEVIFSNYIKFINFISKHEVKGDGSLNVSFIGEKYI